MVGRANKTVIRQEVSQTTPTARIESINVLLLDWLYAHLSLEEETAGTRLKADRGW